MARDWEEFVATHSRIILESSFRVLGFLSEAEDVAQEVLLEVFEKNRMEELFDEPALLRTMATRRAIDRLRRRKEVADIEDQEILGRECEPFEHAVAAEMDHRLQLGIASLPPRESEVFCLSTLEGFTSIEIAKHLGVSTNAVAKSLSMARGRIAKLFFEVREESSKGENSHE